VIAFVGVIYRNDVNLGAESGTSASHGCSKTNNRKATDDADYSSVPGGPRIVPPVGQGIAAGVPEHVWVRL
jgi:hypothetical protein